VTTPSPSTWGKLTDADKVNIVEAIREGETFAAVARRYAIPHSTLAVNVRRLMALADALPEAVVVASPRDIAERIQRIRRAEVAKRVDKILRKAKLPPLSRMPRSAPHVLRPISVIGRRPPPRPIPTQHGAVTDVAALPTNPRDLPRDDRPVMDVCRDDWGSGEADR